MLILKRALNIKGPAGRKSKSAFAMDLSDMCNFACRIIKKCIPIRISVLKQAMFIGFQGAEIFFQMLISPACITRLPYNSCKFIMLLQIVAI